MPEILILGTQILSSHFNDKFYLEKCSIMCFTETKVRNNATITKINELHPQWNDIHSATEHGLSICYKDTVRLIEDLPITQQLEAMACKFETNNKRFIIVLLYRNNKTCILEFFHELINQLTIFASEKLRIILVGDFNLDPWKENNNSHYIHLMNQFGLQLQSDFSTHVHAGALDLILDTKLYDGTKKIEWLPTPFSDHFYIFYGL